MVGIVGMIVSTVAAVVSAWILRRQEKMLKKLSVMAVILAMLAMLLVPTAYAVQSVDAPAQVAL